MDSPVLEHKFKYQARLHVERAERLKPQLRSTKMGGGARQEARSKSDKALARCNLDTSKAQVKMLCIQAMAKAGANTASACAGLVTT
jgi:hypothetical protein